MYLIIGKNSISYIVVIERETINSRSNTAARNKQVGCIGTLQLVTSDRLLLPTLVTVIIIGKLL